jgi:hypothetical protein
MCERILARLRQGRNGREDETQRRGSAQEADFDIGLL